MGTDPNFMTPDEYCQQKAAASGSSFYYSFLFLPPDRRRAGAAFQKLNQAGVRAQHRENHHITKISDNRQIRQ